MSINVTYAITNIEWDTDRQDVEGLPTELELTLINMIEDDLEDEEIVTEEINEYLSDNYGFCVFDYEYEIIAKEYV
jgi:hypothetical protein